MATIPIHYRPTTMRRPWGTETFIAESGQYLGKILRMRAGTLGGLQYHRRKDETFYLVSGMARVDMDDGSGQHRLRRPRMMPGESYRIPAGAVHRVTAITDCVFFEVSTPWHDDRVRVERLYGEPKGTGLPTTRRPRRGQRI